MRHFFKVKTVEEVLALLTRFDPLESETVPLGDSLGRVLTRGFQALEDVPEFDRSSMDGYAVRAKDTFGASESIPALLSVIGEVRMGEAPAFKLQSGQTARVWTGGMLPDGANAVVMIEYARQVDEHTVELAKPVAPFEHVIRRGEDVKVGQEIIPAGRRLRPQDIGLLAALGREFVDVARIPSVAVISTGDEVVAIDQAPGPGQIRDVNSYSLSGQIRSADAFPIPLGLVRDNKSELRDRVAQGLDRADVILISGGSSVGVRDYTLEVIESFPGSEILVHGVSVSPGKPTIMAKIGNKSLWGLPGHTVSAMITCDLFIRPLLARLSGENGPARFNQSVKAILSRNVPSVHGRTDFIRVRLEKNGEDLIAHPVLGKSGLISTMVKADGLIRIELNDEGLLQGDPVDVLLMH